VLIKSAVLMLPSNEFKWILESCNQTGENGWNFHRLFCENWQTVYTSGVSVLQENFFPTRFFYTSFFWYDIWSTLLTCGVYQFIPFYFYLMF